MNKSIIINFQTLAVSLLLLFSYYLFGGWMFFYAIIQLLFVLRNLFKSTEMIEGNSYIYGEHEGIIDNAQIKTISRNCITIIILQIVISLFPLYFMIEEIIYLFADYFDIYIIRYEGGNTVWVLLMFTEAISLFTMWVFLGKYLESNNHYDYSLKYSFGKHQITKANIIQAGSIGLIALIVLIISIYIMGTYTDIGAASIQDQRIHHLQHFY